MVAMELLDRFAFLLHSAILEPDFHLTFAQSDGRGYLDATLTSEILVVAVLFLELERLLP